MRRLAFPLLFASRLAFAQEPPPPTEETKPVEPAPPQVEPAPPPAPPPVKVVEVPPPAPPPVVDDWKFRAGGFVQPQYRLRQNSPAAFDEDGFRLARARLTATADGNVEGIAVSAFIEAELQPTFTLTDAFATISKPLANKGVLTFDLGQTRVPISRQQLISDSRLSFVDKAQLATIAPDRDLGARIWFQPPGLPQLRVITGVFNGEGKNQVQNINEGYLYAGRLEVTPFGAPQPYAESAFKEFASIGLSAGYNKLTPGDYREAQTSLGADISGAYKGLSGSAEFLLVKHAFTGDPTKLPGPDYNGMGWMVQLAYLIREHYEVGARFEEIDRNDTVPIPQLGDPGQSVREMTLVLGAYLRKHTCKAQLAFNHFQEIETKTSTGTDATYPNDQILLQVTYRVE